MSGPRASIYYWKCDRPAAFHGVFRSEETAGPELLTQLSDLLTDAFGEAVQLTPAGGKGNHHTFLVDYAGNRNFVRVEDGPEGDSHLEVESRVLVEVAEAGVPVPEVLFTDASRKQVPFAVQVIGYFECSDLNQVFRQGGLSLTEVAAVIGRNIAHWQNVPVSGFGPFDGVRTGTNGRLTGYHDSYATYFGLHLERHLGVLSADGILSAAESDQIKQLFENNASLLDLTKGVLVHKDLALWNIMGTADAVQAFIDWDDAISGDPLDDVALLGCFYSAEVVQAALDGYAAERPLPSGHLQRFWLHLLRNMIVKAVIRYGAGYFNTSANGAFLMASGQDGPAFKAFTRERLVSAYRGLSENRPLADL